MRLLQHHRAPMREAHRSLFDRKGRSGNYLKRKFFQGGGILGEGQEYLLCQENLFSDFPPLLVLCLDSASALPTTVPTLIKRIAVESLSDGCHRGLYFEVARFKIVMITMMIQLQP